jgi:hypothetical protein
MKKIGLVGGISWTSTMDYYRYINEGINEKLGGLNFAECIIYSLNFGDIQAKGWDSSYELLLNACLSLKKSGAACIVLCANTAHLFADQLQDEVKLPIIDHIIRECIKIIHLIYLLHPIPFHPTRPQSAVCVQFFGAFALACFERIAPVGPFKYAPIQVGDL